MRKHEKIADLVNPKSMIIHNELVNIITPGIGHITIGNISKNRHDERQIIYTVLILRCALCLVVDWIYGLNT